MCIHMNVYICMYIRVCAHLHVYSYVEYRNKKSHETPKFYQHSYKYNDLPDGCGTTTLPR